MAEALKVRSRKLLIAGVLVAMLATLLAALAVARLTTRSVPFKLEDAALITKGVSLEEVEAVLGCPPGHYASRAVELRWPCRGPDESTYKAWLCDEGAIVVFVADGKVEEAGHGYVYPVEETVFEKLRRWLRI
jgi:hypothetical protein